MTKREGMFIDNFPVEVLEPTGDSIEKQFLDGAFTNATRGTGVNRIKKVDRNEPVPGAESRGKNSKSKIVKARKKHRD